MGSAVKRGSRIRKFKVMPSRLGDDCGQADIGYSYFELGLQHAAHEKIIEIVIWKTRGNVGEASGNRGRRLKFNT